MSHGKELGHEYSATGDLPPRWIDCTISQIGLVLIAVFVVAMVFCVACDLPGVFLWLVVAALIATIVMLFVTWATETTSDSRRSKHTTTLNHRLLADQESMQIGDGEVNTRAATWREDDARREADAAAKKVKQKEADEQAKKERDKKNGAPTDFNARRKDLKKKDGFIEESNKIQAQEAEEAKWTAADTATTATPTDSPSSS